MFHWSHHPTPDQAYGHDYENWLKHEKKVDPQELYADLNYFCGPGVATEYHQTTWCSEMAIRFIGERRDRPWMISVNPFDPHGPFDAPPEYWVISGAPRKSGTCALSQASTAAMSSSSP